MVKPVLAFYSLAHSHLFHSMCICQQLFREGKKHLSVTDLSTAMRPIVLHSAIALVYLRKAAARHRPSLNLLGAQVHWKKKKKCSNEYFDTLFLYIVQSTKTKNSDVPSLCYLPILKSIATYPCLPILFSIFIMQKWI